MREFSTEPVDRELIENAIRTAASAPSGANQQPWTFVVVSDPDTKRQLREAAEHEERLLYEERASDEYLSALEPIGTDSVKTHITDAPYVIVVFEQAWGLNPDGTKRKHYYVRESVGIAVGFLKKLLGRPENERPFALIPVGYPAPGAEIPEFALWEKDFAEISAWI